MGLPKRKNNIKVYGVKEHVGGPEIMDRRKGLLERITEADSFLPDSVLHDDLDLGMLEFVKSNFEVTTDNKQIPVIPKILTIQRWGEFSNNWSFSDEDGNVKLPFIAVIRRPDVQPGTNPMVQRTIPDRRTFFYATVPTWNGTQMGADIYKMPQPVAVDITFDVTIVCTKFRDINKFNKLVLQKFSSRQSYTSVKGHYVPIVLDRIEDSSPVESLDNRRFYIQNYTFTMLGFLIDDEEFEVKPAVSRMFLLNEFIKTNNYEKKFIPGKLIDITRYSIVADGAQTQFSVGEAMTELFYVSINGIVQERDVDYFHIPGTSKVTFSEPPYENSVVTIAYYKGKSEGLMDPFGRRLMVANEKFTYDGSSLSFTTANAIDDIVSLEINGLFQEEGEGFEVSGLYEVTLLGDPGIGSTIGIIYLH